jgi:hypothetical protein
MYINSWGASNEYHLPDRSETAAMLALEFWFTFAPSAVVLVPKIRV